MLCLGNAVMLNNWLPEGQQICKDLELTLYSQFEEIVISCLKSIFFPQVACCWIIWEILGISLRMPQNNQMKNDNDVFSEATIGKAFGLEFRIYLKKSSRSLAFG